MSNSSLSFYSNVFGFIVGGISLLGFVAALCRPHLPSNKIKTLESLLHETDNDFRKAVEAGLLLREFIERTEHRLTVLKEQTCGLRARAYNNARTLCGNFAELFSGTSILTSIAIGSTCRSLQNVRADIITSSEERRRRLRETNSAPHPLPPVPATNITPMVERPPTPPPSIGIPRPHSCPPVLPTWISHDLQIDRDPFCDPSRSDSDV